MRPIIYNFKQFKSVFLLILLCLSSHFANSQNKGFIKGNVKDKSSKEVLPGAMVRTSTGEAGISDMDGNFLLTTTEGIKTIEISLLGYQDFQKSVDVIPNDTLKLNVELSSSDQILDEVVISAGRFEQKLSDVTVSMELIKPSLIENKNTTSLDQIMNQVPSVNVTDGQISIRGGSGFSYGAGSRVLMLVDEMPMISADAGDIKWNYLPLENMEQMEVIKGAASALFGSSALNGVINIRTAYAKDKPITNITTFFGNYSPPKRDDLYWWKGKKNRETQGISFSHLQKIGNLDLVLGGNLYKTDGFRYLENENRARFNANVRYNFKKIPGLSMGVNTNVMNTAGGLFFIWQNDSMGYVPRDSSIQVYSNSRVNVDPFIVYNSERTGRHSLRTRFFRTNNTNDKNQSSLADLLYGEYQWQKRFANNFTFTTGLVYMDQQVYADSLYGRHTGNNRAIYLQADKKFGKLTASVGLRGEYFKVDTAKTKGVLFNDKVKNLPLQPVMRAGLNYQLFEYTFLRTSFGQGYRFPSVAEKYISTFVSSLNIYPNVNLQPERGWSAEAGIKQGFKISKFQGFLDVSYFHTEYRNMMDFVFMYDTTGKTEYIFSQPNPFAAFVKYAGFQSQNIATARITGFDISVNGAGKIGPFALTWLCGYTYTNPINPNYDPNKDSSGTLRTNLLKYRNRQLFKNDIQVEVKKFFIGFSSRYNSFMENIDVRFVEPVIYENLNPNTPAYNNPIFYILPGLREYRQKNNKGLWMHDMRVGLQLSKELRFSVIVSNLFNQEYMSRPGFIEAPRNVVFQAQFKF